MADQQQQTPSVHLGFLTRWQSACVESVQATANWGHCLGA